MMRTGNCNNECAKGGRELGERRDGEESELGCMREKETKREEEEEEEKR